MALAPLLLVTLLLVALVTTLRRSLGPVTRERVERFARRQSLPITATNGNLVIAYLATTRRWRASGLALGLAIGIVANVPHGLSIQSLYLLVGWFAGAVIAEWRVSQLPAGQTRAASLVPREPQTYVGRVARAIPLVVAFAAVLLAIISTALVRSQPQLSLATIVTAALCAVAVVAIGRMMEGRVLDRPQPLATTDVIAADDAIRSRSLHVAVGAIATLAAYCVVKQCAAIGEALAGTTTGSWFRGVAAVGLIAAPLLGWVLATDNWHVRGTAVPGSTATST